MATTQQPSQVETRLFTERGVAKELADIAEPVINDLGFRLVRVLVSGRDGGTVQIMAENSDGRLTIEACEKISRELSPIFDLSDAFPAHHRLEISSPGIDRPLVRRSDFETWIDFEAKIEVIEAIDGKKRFRGRLDGIENDEVRLEIIPDTDDREADRSPIVIGLPFGLIRSAKLSQTDELIKAALKQKPHQGKDKQSNTKME